MHTVPAPPATAEAGIEESRWFRSNRAAVLWPLTGIVVAGAALRFATLGLQSYHHDEVITAMRVIPGSFREMLHAVMVSESNPPLYYLLAWLWSQLFGTAEFGLRSLSAVFGTATIPIGYLIGRQLTHRRAGLILAAIVAFNPMLIWYSQEARSYALLVFFTSLAMLFFVRALDSGEGRDVALWALSSALALCSHYFAVFPIAIEGAWLLVAWRNRPRAVLPALGAVVATGCALLPLLSAQVDPQHIGWIEGSPIAVRFWESGVSFLAGETGHVIAEPARDRYALVPLLAVAVGLGIVLVRGSRRERRGAALGLFLGLGVAALAAVAALAGRDYVLERNLLPALVPLALVAAIGLGAANGRRLGVGLAVALCAYWLAFAVYVTRTPNLQRPDFRTLTADLGQARTRRAIASWKLAAEPVSWYLHDGAVRMYGGIERLGEIDLIGKPLAAAAPVELPRSFRRVQRVRLDRLTLTRYVSRRPLKVEFHVLRDLPTGFGRAGVVLDGPRR